MNCNCSIEFDIKLFLGYIGPILPSNSGNEPSPDVSCGPSLPPGFKKEKRILGPTLPSNFSSKRFWS